MNKIARIILALGAVLFLIFALTIENEHIVDYDVIIRGGMIHDGTGDQPYQADLAISNDRIAAIGNLSDKKGAKEINAKGKVVSPGFINMLSWATNSLITDGRGMSDLLQGVTLEVFGEGRSMGPINEKDHAELVASLEEKGIDLSAWRTLGGYLEFLETKGVSPNVASFIGATSVRTYYLDRENRLATPEEMEKMKALVREAMEEGAMGVGSSLIYAPANFADTAELVALSKEASNYNGMYISHMRSEGPAYEEAINELMTIAKEADIPAEIYHLKASGQSNWPKLDKILKTIEDARASGLKITADMYTYPASSTGLDAAMPTWVQEGGIDDWVSRLKQPEIRQRVMAEMRDPAFGIENAFIEIPADKVLIVGVKSDDLKKYIGKTVQFVADEWGVSPEEAAMDLVIKDHTRIQVVYFSMTEENLAKKIRQPWVSFGSDGGALATEPPFTDNSTHPRAYGNFARVIGKFVRDDQVLTLPDAIRKLSGQPATNLKLRDRGFLKEGYYADVLVFDVDKIQDHATFQEPHQYATGMSHVFVNGGHVVKDGAHTGATPGRVVRGPGWTGWQK